MGQIYFFRIGRNYVFKISGKNFLLQCDGCEVKGECSFNGVVSLKLRGVIESIKSSKCSFKKVKVEKTVME